MTDLGDQIIYDWFFYSKNIYHEMCFRMHTGSHLENPVYTELEPFFVFGVIFTILQTRHF